MPSRLVICPNDGKPFRPRWLGQVFCSRRCETEAAKTKAAHEMSVEGQAARAAMVRDETQAIIDRLRERKLT